MSNAHNERASSTSTTSLHLDQQQQQDPGLSQRLLSQLTNNVPDLTQFVQSNSFLRSDLGEIVQFPNNNNYGDSMSFPNRSTNIPNRQNQQHQHNHGHSHQTPSAAASSSSAPASSDVVINFGQNPNELHQHQHQAPPQQPPDALAPNNALGYVIKSLQSTAPFIFIVVAKIFHQHLFGFFVILAFLTTLHWSNQTLVHQVELKDKKQNLKLILLILFLLTNVSVFFFIFSEYKLQNCLIMISTNIPKMDVWNLIWIVVCSDTIIKFMIISVKALFTLLPFSIVPLRKRGNYYSAIETFALFYRSLTPIHPYILFLLYSDINVEILNQHVSGSDLALKPGEAVNQSAASVSKFPIILCIIYCLFKLNQLYTRVTELNESVSTLFKDTSYGVPISVNELQDLTCPICQDKYLNPVVLKCKHAFCQDCVCVWLDKENSCPMCRAKVAVKKPKFKDGSTTILIQWF